MDCEILMRIELVGFGGKTKPGSYHQATLSQLEVGTSEKQKPKQQTDPEHTCQTDRNLTVSGPRERSGRTASAQPEENEHSSNGFVITNFHL